jgi:hypothetical protein
MRSRLNDRLKHFEARHLAGDRSNAPVLGQLGPSREKLLKLGFGGLDDFVVQRFDQFLALTARS